MDPTTPRLEPKLLYRRLDRLFGRLDPTLPQRRALESFLADAFSVLKDDLRLRAAILYGEGRDGFEQVKSAGQALEGFAESFAGASAPWSLLLHHGVYIFDGTGPTPWTAGSCAGVAVGTRPLRHILLFALKDGWIREELDFTLNTIRAALGSRFMEERVRGSFRQAAEIQGSLLLEEPPAFPGYELASRSIPAEEVGGDFFDFLVFEDELLGLSIGDASGHGLPAALLVRDVVTGLRMGVEKDLKIAYVFSKLNRVIHRSNLSSRFVSVFHGELERNGNLIFVNAGHPPPLLFTEGRIVELSTGGTVIGPMPEAKFQRGVAYMEPGDVLVLCTDGILERRDGGSEDFGERKLREVVRAARGLSAGDILGRLFEEAWRFGDGHPWDDDVTAVVVRRLPPGATAVA
jgi:sigma-B regulation protein RsbU (phosphoserine phosphatase)